MQNENVKDIISIILIGAMVLGIYAFYVIRESGKERAKQEAAKETERISEYQKDLRRIAEIEANTMTRKMIISHRMKYTENMNRIYVAEIKNIYAKTITNIVFGFSNSDGNKESSLVFHYGTFYDSRHNVSVNIPPNQTEHIKFPLNYYMNQLDIGGWNDINSVMIVAVRFEDGSIEKGYGYKDIY